MKSIVKELKRKHAVKNLISKIAPGFGIFAFLVLGVVLIIAPTPAFSAPSNNKVSNKQIAEISEKEDEIIIQKTNSYYNKGQYLKAVDEINISIESHQRTKDLPDNIQLMGEASYYSWINTFYRNSRTIDRRTYDKIILYLTLHPEVMSSRIESLVYEVYENEKLYYEKDRVQAAQKNDRRKLDSILKELYRIDQDKRDLDEVIRGTKTVEDILKAIQVEHEYKKAQYIKYLMITLYTLIFIAIVVLIMFFRRNQKKMLHAQTQFETTMKVVAILQRDSSMESPYSPLRTNEDETRETKVRTRAGRRFGLSDYESQKIAAEYFEQEDSKKQFLQLQNQCMELGDRIDRATGRRRNSKKVSELVFKLCKVADVDDELSLIYYCAAMVYDAGFLSISRNILQGEHLTIKERYEVRSHVQKATEYFAFVPESIKRIFLDAAEFHHENMDGKGYLAGLSGSKIPLISRFIRVAESYISLINSRSYKKIMDSESALNELKKKSGIYDPKILALLEKVI
ncbi:HD-GYP domain-containing protein [Treponema sp.]|uniref:HD-GYP domain-containing protein n=1 Tax=Treponema sp. TaxID=166 RepID=UPI00298E756E|nr:HD domain-containing phosphohydrolase [Treponema sp.]MCR5613884.1 hypothetical protein [Treponema sp.]